MRKVLWLAMLGCLAKGAAAMAEPGEISIELNKLEPGETSCQPYLVVENGTEHAFSSLKLDLVMFDVDGVIARRVAVDAAPLRRRKMTVKVFDLDDLACDRIGRMLLNGLTSCETEAAVGDCLDLISTRSQADVPFIQ